MHAVIMAGVTWEAGTPCGKYHRRTQTAMLQPAVRRPSLRTPKTRWFTAPQKLVALVGMKDVIVVETKDALLICKKGRSQDVKKIVDALEAERKTQLL